MYQFYFIFTVCSLSLLTLCGCNAQIDAKVTPVPTTSRILETPAPSQSAEVEPSTASRIPETPAPSQSVKVEPSQPSNSILEGRYWIGGTDQALEVQGDRYRYETEGGTQPWRSLQELQSTEVGVVYDGNAYWCLSTLKPETGIATCSKQGWTLKPITSIE